MKTDQTSAWRKNLLTHKWYVFHLSRNNEKLATDTFKEFYRKCLGTRRAHQGLREKSESTFWPTNILSFVQLLKKKKLSFGRIREWWFSHNLLPRRPFSWLNTVRHFLFDREHCISAEGCTARALKHILVSSKRTIWVAQKDWKKFSTKRKM